MATIVYATSMLRRFEILGLMGVTIMASNCALFGGGGGDGFRHATGYLFSAPTEWKSIDKGESDAAYRLPSGAIMEMTSSCTRASAAPLEVLTKHLLLGSRNIRIERQERIKISDGDGLLTQLTSQNRGSPVFLNIIVFAERGCIFDLSLLGSRRFSETELSQYLQLARSFRYGAN